MPLSKQTTHGSVVLTIRRAAITATIFMLVGGGSSLAEEGIGGWVVEWNATTTGGYSESDGCVGTLSNGDCYSLSNSMEIEGQSSGRYIIMDGGLILNGSAQADYVTEKRQQGNGVCWPDTTVGDFFKIVSQHTHSGSGPEKGAQGSIFETLDYDGSPIVSFNFNYGGSCSGVFSETITGVDSTTCQPYEDTVITPYFEEGTCDGWAQLPRSAGIGHPDDESRLSYSGTEIINNEIPVGNWMTVTGIPYTTTMTMTAEKIPVPVIHGIELTQAMQIYQTLDDMAGTIGSTGSPPIPIVAYKPLAIRVVLDKPVVTVKAIIEVSWNGTKLDSKSITQPPTCEPPDMTGVNKTIKSSRQNLNGCKTADFIVRGLNEGGSGPIVNEGNNRLLVKLYSDDPRIGIELLNEYEYVINAKASNTVVLGAVNVCATRTGDRWGCVSAPVRDLVNGAVLMGKIYPTDEVSVFPTNQFVRLELVKNEDTPAPDYNADGTNDEWDCYDSHWTKVYEGSQDVWAHEAVRIAEKPIIRCEKEIWWSIAAAQVDLLYRLWEHNLIRSSGLEWYFYGLVNPSELTAPTFGATLDEPGRAAVGVTTGPAPGYLNSLIDDYLFRDTVAHEVGHLFGLAHVPDISPEEMRKTCGKFDTHIGPPFGTPELYLFSDYKGIEKQELAFDVTRNKVIQPFTRHDVMSYCDGPLWAPNWVSPKTYLDLYKVFHPDEEDDVSPGSQLFAKPESAFSTFALTSVEAGKYWLVSGFVMEDIAFLDAVFIFETVGPIDEGAGSHKVEVLDGSGSEIFTRRFTPAASQDGNRDRSGKLTGLPRSFAQLVPVQQGAVKIVIRDAAGTALAEELMGGLAPELTLVLPVGGEQIAGQQTLAWTATDDDTDLDNLVYWVQYSADAGNNWITLAQGLQETSLVVDFDDLPGALGTALIRILASDRVNTGFVTSSTFTVGKKLPTVDILSPEIGDVTKVGGLVFFEGYGYDLDDGALPSNTHSWASDRDGDIGVGYKVSTSGLSEGQHNIRLSVTDSDSNVAFADVTVLIGDFADEDGDGVADGQDQCPGTPAGEVVNANGCSASQLDSDADGVSDSDDQCPGTPAGEAVNAVGCSASQRDSDGDGVNDALDQCAGTPAGTAVGSNGCPVSPPGNGGSSGSGGGSAGLFAILFLGLAAVRRRTRTVNFSDLNGR